MFSKSLLVLAAASAIFSGSSFAAPTPIILNKILSTATEDTYTGAFEASVIADTFSIKFPSGISNLTSALVVFTLPGLYSASNVTFAGNSFTKSNPLSYLTVWNYTLNNIHSGTYNIKVTGSGLGTALGAIQFITAVPEPASIALMLAGLVMVGGLQLRRKNTASRLAG